MKIYTGKGNLNWTSLNEAYSTGIGLHLIKMLAKVVLWESTSKQAIAWSTQIYSESTPIQFLRTTLILLFDQKYVEDLYRAFRMTDWWYY